MRKTLEAKGFAVSTRLVAAYQEWPNTTRHVRVEDDELANFIGGLLYDIAAEHWRLDELDVSEDSENARPRGGSIEIWVCDGEKNEKLKLSLPTPLAGGRVRGQAAYGVEEHQREAEELVAQKWIAVISPSGVHALTLINDATYGFDFAGGELRLSLLRSPAYSGHPVDDVTPIVRQDRFEPRIDQGEHRFRFWLNAGTAATRLCAVDREATAKHEAPLALCAWPRGGGAKARPAILFSDDVVQLGAMKIAESGDRLILRLFEPAGEARAITITIPPLDLRFDVALGAFEIKTLAIDLKTRMVEETDLLERKVVRQG